MKRMFFLEFKIFENPQNHWKYNCFLKVLHGREFGIKKRAAEHRRNTAAWKLVALWIELLVIWAWLVVGIRCYLTRYSMKPSSKQTSEYRSLLILIGLQLQSLLNLKLHVLGG